MSLQELEKVLAALRAENRGVEAPKQVETALRSAFRAHAPVPARHVWRPWILAAAAVVVLISAAAWKMAPPLPSPPAVTLTVAPPAPVPLPASPAKLEKPLAANQVKRPTHRRVPPARPQPPAPEVATEFMPLEDTMHLSPIESGHVLRVALPRSTMVRFGFPVNPDRMLEPVKADVVFAQDGIARAIRFVK